MKRCVIWLDGASSCRAYFKINERFFTEDGRLDLDALHKIGYDAYMGLFNSRGVCVYNSKTKEECSIDIIKEHIWQRENAKSNVNISYTSRRGYLDSVIYLLRMAWNYKKKVTLFKFSKEFKG